MATQVSSMVYSHSMTELSWQELSSIITYLDCQQNLLVSVVGFKAWLLADY